MSPTLVLFLLVLATGVWLAGHFLFERVGRRHLVVSGSEYLLLGMLLGPGGTGVVGDDAVARLAPFLALALGWVGAVVGAQFDLRALGRLPSGIFRLAWMEAMTTGLLTSAAMTAVLVATGVSLPAALPAGLALGTIAIASAPAAAALAHTRVPLRAGGLRLVQITSAVDAVVAIVAVGLLLAILNPGVVSAYRAPTATEWVVIGLATGVGGGILFHLFLGGTGPHDTDRLFVALAGALLLVAGASVYTRLSTLLPSMLVGAILGNAASTGRSVRLVLSRLERPIYFVLLLFAGFMWNAGAPSAWVVVGAFVVVRLAAKLIGAWLARAIGRTRDVGAFWGLALLGHGGLGVAVVLDIRLSGGGPWADLALTAGVVSILLVDAFSARLALVGMTDRA